ncbi:YraN family protein [Eggerthellaceae bacterium 24-137]
MKFENRYSDLEADISGAGAPYRLAIRGPHGEVRLERDCATYDEALRAMNDFCGWDAVGEPSGDPDPLASDPVASKLRGTALEAARRFLERNGYSVLEVDWGCAHGTCDVIAFDGTALAFVEVLAKDAGSAGLPCDAVRKSKRERMERIAVAYLEGHFFGEAMVRFDVLSMTVLSRGRCLIRHHIGAYSGS